MRIWARFCAILAAAGRAVGNVFTTTTVPEIKGVIASWFADVSGPPLIALGLFVLFLLLRVVLRRTWLAALPVILLLTGFATGPQGFAASTPLFGLPIALLMLVLSMRFGMLAFAVAFIATSSFTRYPVTSNFSAWYAPLGLMEVALVLAMTVWCFRNALGGRKVWKGEFLDH